MQSSRSIDSTTIISLRHIRKVTDSYLTGTEKGCHTVFITWSNGDKEHLRYESEEDRDDDLAEFRLLMSKGDR